MKKSTKVLAYTAGIIDGDGTICLGKEKCLRVKRGYHIGLRVSVGNTQEWLIQWLKMQYGGHITYNSQRKSVHNKPYWQWNIKARKAGEFLKIIIPYLYLKRPQAELALKFQASRGRQKSGQLTDAEAVIQEADRIVMKQFNRRGR